MKRSWMIVVGMGVAFSAGCDDSTSGSGGATGTTSSTKASTGTMSTGTTSTSTSTGGDPKAMACESACTEVQKVATQLMCTDTKAECLAACGKNFTDFPTCEKELLALWNCIAMEFPSATECSCDAMGDTVCNGVCGAEVATAGMCTNP